MDEEVTFTKIIEEISEEYSRALKELSTFSETLIERLETLTKELAESRKIIGELEDKNLKHSMYHPVGFVNRVYFDIFMQTELKRKATDQEWVAFNESFTFNTNSFRSAIYGWIDGWKNNSADIKPACD